MNPKNNYHIHTERTLWTRIWEVYSSNIGVRTSAILIKCYRAFFIPPPHVNSVILYYLG
jgi:hypothetical protein